MRTRIVFPLFFVFVFSTGLSAQWSAGISGGADFSFLKWQFTIPGAGLQDLDYQPALGWQTALGVEWSSGPLLSIRAQGGLQQWRNRIDGEVTDGTGGNSPAKIFSNFLSVSGAVLAKITPLKHKNVYLLAGPSMAYILDGKGKVKVDNPQTGIELKASDIDLSLYNRVQYYTDLGAGYQTALGAQGKLHIEARYQFGLQEFTTAPTVDSRLNNLLVTAGYAFSF